jgi:hypothetical protein
MSGEGVGGRFLSLLLFCGLPLVSDESKPRRFCSRLLVQSGVRTLGRRKGEERGEGGEEISLLAAVLWLAAGVR